MAIETNIIYFLLVMGIPPLTTLAVFAWNVSGQWQKKCQDKFTDLAILSAWMQWPRVKIYTENVNISYR